MRVLLISLLSLSFFNAYASDLVRVQDGLTASCKMKYDVIRSKANNVYGLSKPTIKINALTVELKLNIDFYECVENNGKFYFKKLDHHMSADYNYTDFRTNTTVQARRIDKKKEVLAIDELNSIVGKSSILKENGQHYVLLTIEKTKLDINNFPAAQDKGNYHTTLMLRSLSKVVTPEIDLGFGYVASGSYRLFLDLKKMQATF